MVGLVVTPLVRARYRWIRVLHANLPLPAATVTTPLAGLPPLEIRIKGKAILPAATVTGVLIVVYILTIVGVGRNGMSIAAWIDSGAVGVCLIYVLTVLVRLVRQYLRWVLPDRPLFRVDDRGFFLARWKALIPWDLVTEIRIYAAPPTRKSGSLAAFMLADTEATQRAIPARGLRRMMARSARVAGTPLAFTGRVLDTPASQIAEAAAAASGLPLRRYPRWSDAPQAFAPPSAGS